MDVIPPEKMVVRYCLRPRGPVGLYLTLLKQFGASRRCEAHETSRFPDVDPDSSQGGKKLHPHLFVQKDSPGVV